MAATSLKTNAELYNPKASPLAIQNPSLVHYIDLLKETNFLTWVANTMLVAVVATFISLLLGSMLAYPLARMRFRGAVTAGHCGGRDLPDSADAPVRADGRSDWPDEAWVIPSAP